MKKVLFATSALILTGGAAMAEVTISGNGRFGLVYNETDTVGDSETQISTRLRFNIDASKETDSGVTFGGRIRLQYDDGDSDLTTIPGPGGGTSGSGGAELSAAKLYAKYGGMTLEVGNVDTAYDSAALMYNSEIGFKDSSAGDPQGSYFSFESGPFGAEQVNRMGLAFFYSVENFNARVSWVQADQTGTLTTGNLEDEYGLSVDYTFGQFTVSAAAVLDGAGIKSNDNYFIGGEYAFSDVGNVGLQYFDNGDSNGASTAGDNGQQITLYGNYTFGAVTVKGYIANNDADGNEDDTVAGIGADYDLGGATLSGSVRSGYNGNTSADVGVRFNF